MALNARPRQPAGVADPVSVTSTPTDEPRPEPSRPCIVLDRVSLRFRSERGEVQALSDISLRVAEGEFVALLGPTGCGKSSLLRLVSDLIPPTSGTIEVRGGPASAARHVNDVRLRLPGAGAAVLAHRDRQRPAAARGRRLSARAAR